MPKFDHIGPQISQENTDGTMWVVLTGRNIAATEAAQAVINANIQVGHVVVADPNKVNIPTENRGSTICVTQAQGSHLDGPIYVVEAVGKDVNDAYVGGLTNERKGGLILVRKVSGECSLLVPDGTAVGGYMVPAAGAYAVAAVGATGIASIAAINTHKFRALEANSSGGAALRRAELKSA